MMINKAFLDFLYQPEKVFSQGTNQTFIQKEPAGELVVSEGAMILADPYAINYGVRIQADPLLEGVYNAWLYSAIDPIHGDKHNAALLIAFSEEIPVEWLMCLPEDVDPASIPDDGYFGVPTKSGNLAVMAEKTCRWLLENPDDAGSVLEAMEEEIAATYFEIGGLANVHLPDKKANLLAVVVTGEAGVYPAYWGMNQAGDKVCLVIDFLALEEESA